MKTWPIAVHKAPTFQGLLLPLLSSWSWPMHSLLRLRLLNFLFFLHSVRKISKKFYSLFGFGRICPAYQGRFLMRWTDQVKAAVDGSLYECTRKVAMGSEACHQTSTDDHDHSVKSVATKKNSYRYTGPYSFFRDNMIIQDGKHDPS